MKNKSFYKKIKAINEYIAPEKVAAEVVAFDKFWVGEDYHQNYERLHPNQGYIKAISVPRLNRFKENFPHLLKEGAKH